MDSTELAEHLEEGSTDDPYYELLILDFGTDRPAWWACNLCGREIPDGQGCPAHAPRDVPGLRRAECDADPKHPPVWYLDGENYGTPCPSCIYAGVAADLAKAKKTDRCYHWPWRRWSLTHKVAGYLYVTGICASGGGTRWGNGCDRCQDVLPRLRGKRPYILGVPRETWRCWLVGHHRRGEEVGFGFCGKCVPWTCCGSQREDHAAGCTEDVRDALRTEVAS
jgi:hypothetical protein